MILLENKRRELTILDRLEVMIVQIRAYTLILLLCYDNVAVIKLKRGDNNEK